MSEAADKIITVNGEKLSDRYGRCDVLLKTGLYSANVSYFPSPELVNPRDVTHETQCDQLLIVFCLVP